MLKTLVFLTQKLYNMSINGMKMKGSNYMAISKEEILHIADLADLKIKDNEVDNYAKNLEDILNFAKIINSVDTNNVKESIGTFQTSNVFRKDEVVEFEDKEALLQNAPEKENNMFKIPKVIN